MERSNDKLLSLEDLASTVRDLQQANRIVAMCHGCFDILHVGHVRHFEAARAMADVLVVTVTADRFVNKGPNRPVFPEGQRAELVAALRMCGLGCGKPCGVSGGDHSSDSAGQVRQGPGV